MKDTPSNSSTLVDHPSLKDTYPMRTTHHVARHLFAVCLGLAVVASSLWPMWALG